MFRPPTAEQRDRARRALGLGVKPAIGFVGRLSAEKRIDVAITAVAALPDHVLVVAGDGPLRADAERQAEAEAPGRVSFLGEVGDVIPVLHAVDVLVITSEAEGMPGVAIGQACGSSSGTRSSLAAALSDTTRGPARADATELGWPRVTDRWVELLSRLAGGTDRRGLTPPVPPAAEPRRQ